MASLQFWNNFENANSVKSVNFYYKSHNYFTLNTMLFQKWSLSCWGLFGLMSLHFQKSSLLDITMPVFKTFLFISFRLSRQTIEERLISYKRVRWCPFRIFFAWPPQWWMYISNRSSEKGDRLVRNRSMYYFERKEQAQFGDWFL